MLVRFSISALCVVEDLREWRHGRGERRLNDQIDSPWTQTFINRAYSIVVLSLIGLGKGYMAVLGSKCLSVED